MENNFKEAMLPYYEWVKGKEHFSIFSIFNLYHIFQDVEYLLLFHIDAYQCETNVIK